MERDLLVLGENVTFQKKCCKKKNKRKNMPIKKLSMVEMICFFFCLHSRFHKLLQLFYRSSYFL